MADRSGGGLMFTAFWRIAFGTRPEDISASIPDWHATRKWWQRNPIHNLTHHLLSVYFLRQVVLLGKVTKENELWPVGSILLAINGLPCLSIQTGRIETYVGWRPRVVAGQRLGVFGLALRRVSKQ